MSEWSLPTLTLNPLAAFGILLIVGVLGGQIARRVVHLPAITGYVLAGLIISPAGLALIDAEMLRSANLFLQLALGLALFEIGRRIDLTWLRRERILLGTVAIGCLIVFVGVFAVLVALGIPGGAAVLTASVAMMTSPVVILEIVRESRAEGQVTERLMTATGLGNLFGLVAFGIAISYNHFEAAHGVEESIIGPGWLVLGSVALGLVSASVAIRVNQWLGGRERDAQAVLLFGIIALVVGLSALLDFLPPLALLVLGVGTRQIERGHTVTEPPLAGRSSFFFVAFFVAAGAQLSPGDLRHFALVATAWLAVRTLSMMVVWWAAARANGLTHRRGAWLGLALSPLSGGTHSLALLGATSLPAGSAAFTGLMLAGVFILEIAGPILTRFALQQAGETPR